MKQQLTLEQLAAELTRRKEVQRDYIVDTRRIHMVTGTEGSTVPLGRSEVDLIGAGADEWSVGLVCNELFHEQIGGHLSIPRKFYERIRTDYPGLLDTNVNTLLRGKPEKRMIRTLDGTARAFLSDRYLRRDNFELAQAVLPILSDIPDVVISSSALTDRRMYIKATTPALTGQIKVGDEVCAGVYFANSEVGCGAVEIFPFIMRKICSNGMIVRQQGAGMMRKIHLGPQIEANEAAYAIFSDETLMKDDEAFFAKCEDVVRAAVSEVTFRDLVAQMAAAAEDRPVEDPVAAVKVLSKREGLHEDESKNVLKYLVTGGDLSRWGLLNAVTRAAEDQDSYDDATAMEALGGKMLDYVPADWTPIATATS